MSDNPDILEEEVEVESVEDLVENLYGLTENEYQSIRAKALEEGKTRKHDWRMKGRGVLECRSCPFPHRAFIDPELRLIGLDEQGNPLFDKRQNSLLS